MPFGGLGTIGALVSGGSALAGLFGGSPASQVQLPPQYQFQNTSGADNNAYNSIGGLSQYNVPAQLLPQYQQIAQNAVNNPYGGGYQQGAGVAGAMGQGAGTNAYGAGGSLMFNGQGLSPDITSLLNMGFDPQNALYARNQQRNMDQTNATAGQYGIQGTPYGAGVANQSNQNFNMDWENNALARAVSGAQGAGNLMGTQANAFTTGAALQGGGANTYLQGSAAPYNAFQGMSGNALSTLGGTGAFGLSAAQIPQQQIGDYLQYLSQATSQQGANNQTSQLGLNQAQGSFNQNQIMGGQLGSSLAQLSRGWGSNSGGWGSSVGGLA